MNRFFPIIIFVTIPFFSIHDILSANNLSRDTLPDDIHRIEQKLDLIRDNLGAETDSFIHLTRKVLRTSQKINYTNGINRSYLYLAKIYRARNVYDSAIFYYEQGLANPFNNYDLKAHFYRDLSNTYRIMGEYSLAMEHSLNLKELAENEKTTHNTHYIYNLLALSYQTLMEYDLAKKYYNYSIQLALQNNNEAYAGIVLANMGKLYFEQDKLDSALYYFERGVKIEEKYELFANAGNSYNTIANIYLKKELTDSAYFYLLKAVKYNNQSNNRIGLVHTLMGVSNYYFQMEKYENALEHIEKTISYAKEIKLNNVLSDALYLKSRINANQGRYQEAYQSYNDYFELYKDIYDVKKINQVKTLEYQLIQQKKEKEMVELELKKQQTINRLFFIIGGLLIIIIIIAFLFIIHYKKSNIALINAKKRAEESDQLKSQFLKTISHEIRTPLNGIVGFSEILTSEEINQTERKEIDQVIQKNSNELISTIDNLVDLAHLTTHQYKVNYKDIELSSFLTNLVSKIKNDYFLQEKDIKIRLVNPSETILKSDKYVLQKIISELLKNAILYTVKGEINIGFKKNQSELILFVKDTGPGIPKDILDKIFTPFRRGKDYSNGKIGGSGIGLALAYNFSKVIDATLTVDSKTGQGSNFEIIIPFRKNNVNRVNFS
ncbi:MAG: tetratricopeptide repeat-containing sensor histidine kinase [Bacteroidales bacterium]|jgi:signal transduction histidine kinase|nr:tetratricopeptide repeat-containing sensor histidine kinase [Bacteroidales bacterium]